MRRNERAVGLVLASVLWGMVGMGMGQTMPATQAATRPAVTKLKDSYAMTAKEFFADTRAAQRFSATELDVDLLEAALFHATNLERMANKLPVFLPSRKLTTMARAHSQEMVKLQYFAHESPVAQNATLEDRFKQVKLVTNFTGAENIAVLPTMEMGSGEYEVNGDGSRVDAKTRKRLDYCTYEEFAKAMVETWMQSPHHHANIVDPANKFLGLGVARGAYEKQDSVYGTQNFASRVGGDDKAFVPAVAKP